MSGEETSNGLRTTAWEEWHEAHSPGLKLRAAKFVEARGIDTGDRTSIFWKLYRNEWRNYRGYGPKTHLYLCRVVNCPPHRWALPPINSWKYDRNRSTRALRVLHDAGYDVTDNERIKADLIAGKIKVGFKLEYGIATHKYVCEQVGVPVVNPPKVVWRCPECGARAPKEFREGEE